MSDRNDTDYPDDEPVIGANYAPSAPPPPPPIGKAPYIGGPGPAYDDARAIGYNDPQTEGPYDDDEFDDDEYYDEDEDDEYGYYDDDDYEEAVPARQPMFYVFIALAALVGGIVVFLLFSLVNNNGDSGEPALGGTKFAVVIGSPVKGTRIEVGKPQEVIVEASATETITRFELFVGDKLTDTVNVTETPSDNKYRAVLKYTLASKGNYDLRVKVTASSGATKESAPTQVTGFESVGERPQTIKGKVVADTTLHTGPGDSFPESGTLKAGTEVTIVGKDKDVQWLLVDSLEGQQWAKRNAINELDTLDLVPTRGVTPTPAPTQPPTNTVAPSPSVTTSPTTNPSAPDFVPTNAVLVEGGSVLRVTVQNSSNNPYNGPLVIAVSGDVPAAEIVIDANLGANGTATVDFDLNPPITTDKKKAVVSVDPKNAIKESRENNNDATFVLLAPEEAPAIVVQAPTVADKITVTIKNNGGPLAATTVTVRVKAENSEAAQSQNLALATGQTATFVVSKPGTGAATAEVVINDQVVASAEFTIPE
ncbi:MAG: CARDB domain-containing protein [Tepidiformaceae bacterium]